VDIFVFFCIRMYAGKKYCIVKSYRSHVSGAGDLKKIAIPTFGVKGRVEGASEGWKQS